MNILITGAFPEASKIIPALRYLGHQIVFMQSESERLNCNPDWVEGIIGNNIFLSHPIEQFKNLYYIQLTSAGFDRVPMAYVKEHGIRIKNARGVYSIPMAEFAISGVLQLYKQAKFFIANQKQHVWEKHRGLMELCGKTACVVGCGSVGTECAKRFGTFGCEVIGVDIFPRVDEHYVKMVGLDEIERVLPIADVILLTLPLTEQSRHLMNTARLALVKPSTILVNIARGAVVDKEALICALEEKRISGAVLDVFEEEPLGESCLWDMNNVLITPHNSFVSDKNADRMHEITLNNLKETIQQ